MGKYYNHDIAVFLLEQGVKIRISTFAYFNNISLLVPFVEELRQQNPDLLYYSDTKGNPLLERVLRLGVDAPTEGESAIRTMIEMGVICE